MNLMRYEFQHGSTNRNLIDGLPIEPHSLVECLHMTRTYHYSTAARCLIISHSFLDFYSAQHSTTPTASAPEHSDDE